MNMYLNKEQQEVLKALLDAPSLEAMSMFENAEELLGQLRSKVNKKKIDKKAKLPSQTFVDTKGKELAFTPRKDNGAMILKANKENYPADYKDYFRFNWDFETFISIANFLHDYAIFTGDHEYEVCQVAYCEEFNVFKDGVERSIDINGSKMSFICYTGDANDNDWTYLLPNRVKGVLRIMVAYIFLHEKLNEYFETLHVDIQGMYNGWLEAGIQKSVQLQKA